MMRWSKEKAWEWYDSRPWLRGCNYMSADCANRVDQWQALGFEERFQTTETELALMQKTGFNTVRLIPEYVVWKEEHDGFMERFDRYLSLCAKYGISCMIVLANDCMPPKNELWKKPFIGEQSVAWGYHGGKKSAQHSSFAGVAPHFYFDDPEECERYFDMVREIVTTYRNDARVCIWDVYNEPGAGRRTEITPPILQRMFDTVRACEPSQPLTSAVWSCEHLLRKSDSNPHKQIEDIIFANSDIISYHYYGEYNTHVRIIKRLKEEGRPIVNTEWLGRIFHNDVFSLFPLFYLEKIGCYNWGFVAGKYQTYEPWDATWSAYERGELEDVDFTKWFHDLYRPGHHPYDPKEIKLIREFCDLADNDHREQTEKRKHISESPAAD
ncbi:MAG: cellulase family glycosylhydrolase [Clostridia bacterium]|nr:cellulase family glycosylhydrolase [Clostridia bacterium]